MTNYISGMRTLYSDTSNNAINAERRVRDVHDAILLLDPNNSPLTTLLRRLRRKRTQDPKFEWFEDVFPEQSTTVADAAVGSSGDTSVAVATGTGKYGRAGDLWWNAANGEVIYITSVSTDTWTVIRGVGSSIGSWSSDDELFYIGNAQETGAAARAKLTTIAEEKYNYTQIFKEGWEITRTANQTALYGGPDRNYLRRKHGLLHNRDIERSFWFGLRDRLGDGETGITTTAYITGGVFEWISTNEHTNSASSLTEDEFDGYLRQDFRYGNEVKFMFCSPMALSVISSWGRDKLQMVPRDKTYGINISRFISPHGELNLIKNKLFYDFSVSESASTNYSKASVILDLEDLRYRFLQDTMLDMNIHANDEDRVEDQYLTDCGLELWQEKHHAQILDWAL